jgi:Predicted membrane protein
MKINHSAIGKLIRKNLENLDEDKLVGQIEDKIGNDLQYIRINGAITGSFIGIIIAV